jgi:hypothetical protein
MVKYVCGKCGEDFGNRRSNHTTHINRTKSCITNSLIKANEQIYELKVLDILDINTYKDLYLYLLKSNISFDDFISQGPRGNIEPQECIFKLFAKLGLFEILHNATPCLGNFNKCTIKSDATFAKLLEEKLSHGGDCADMILVKDDTLYALTSKNNADKNSVGSLDLAEIDRTFSKFYSKKYKHLKYIICVKDKQKLNKSVKYAHSSSILDIKAISNAIIIDQKDLMLLYNIFLNKYSSISYLELIKCSKGPIIPRFHQDLTINKTIDIFKNKKNILWGHIPRSGKSYIMAQLIDQWTGFVGDANQSYNYLIITTAPNETINQYINIFESHIEFHNYNVIDTRSSTRKPTLGNKNIIIISLQKIKNNQTISLIKPKPKSNPLKKGEKKPVSNLETINLETTTTYDVSKITWISNINIDIMFLDECHNGGTTDLSKKVLSKYKSKKICYITATYNKPLSTFDVDSSSCITWDLEDIMMCKKIDLPHSVINLSNKHGAVYIKQLLIKYPTDLIMECYAKYPNLHLMSYVIKPDIKNDIISLTKDSKYGLSVGSILMLKPNLECKTTKYKNKFEDEMKVKQLCDNIFGKVVASSNLLISINDKKNTIKIANNTQKTHSSIMYEAEKIFDANGSRWFSVKNPLTMLIVLPISKGGDITTKCKTFKKYLIDHNYCTDYIIDYSTSSNNTSVKTIVDNAQQQAINNGKIGSIILIARQGTLGITYEKCDLILYLSNTQGDIKWQTMFRCMTEAPGKTMGLVVEMSIQNNLKTIMDYAMQLLPTKSNNIHETIKYIYEQQLITLHSSDWLNDYFDKDVQDFDKLASQTMKLLMSDPINNVSIFMDQFQKINIDITIEENKLISGIFKIGNITNKNTIKKAIEELLMETPSDINLGITETKITTNEDNMKTIEEVEEITKEEKINLINDMLKHIIPMVCFLTYDTDIYDFELMCNQIKSNKHLKEILLSAMHSWWKKEIKSDIILDLIVGIYNKYLINNELMKNIINFMKNGIKNNLDDMDILSQLIDKYLIPHENDRSVNAEISTPYQLRQDMLDSIDKYAPSLWTGVEDNDENDDDESCTRGAYIFEPCCGKGGFLVDIIGRLVKGLGPSFDSVEECYQYVVEECVYFADINELNIFICKLLLDPYNKYKLNYHLGDSLKLDPFKKWGVKSFDAVIGNPPYNGSSGTNTGNTLWNKFVVQSIKWLSINGYLLYVHPAGWRKPCNSKSQFKKLFNLMTKNNKMLYLEIHGISDGKKVFNCDTRYDWYLIQHPNTNKDYQITIKNEKNIIENVLICNCNWLPNYNINNTLKLFSSENNNLIIMDSMYHATRDYVSNIKDKFFKYPLIHSTPKLATRYKYSKCNNKGHFGISKIIFGESGINLPIIDMEGKYGMTQGAIAIKVNNLETAKNIVNVLTNIKFKDLLNCMQFGTYRIDANIFRYIKKEFYLDFSN